MADRSPVHGRKLLAGLLAFAPTTYLHWPEATALRVALQVSMARNLSSTFDPRTLIAAAASDAGGIAGEGGGVSSGSGAQVTLMTAGVAKGAGAARKGGRASVAGHGPRLCSTSLWRVRFERMQRIVSLPGQQQAKMTLSPSRAPSIMRARGGGGAEGYEELWTGRNGVSLATLGILRVVNSTRACLFRATNSQKSVYGDFIECIECVYQCTVTFENFVMMLGIS
jgi:hypothetical protein